MRALYRKMLLLLARQLFMCLFLLGGVQCGTLETDVGKVTPMTVTLMDLSKGSKEDIKGLKILAASYAKDVNTTTGS